MSEIMNSIIEEEKMKENIFDKIAGLTAEINQMKQMIEENIRLIAEGDDVEGRTFLKTHLENEVRKKESELSKLNKIIQIKK